MSVPNGSFPALLHVYQSCLLPFSLPAFPDLLPMPTGWSSIHLSTPLLVLQTGQQVGFFVPPCCTDWPCVYAAGPVREVARLGSVVCRADCHARDFFLQTGSAPTDELGKLFARESTHLTGSAATCSGPAAGRRIPCLLSGMGGGTACKRK